MLVELTDADREAASEAATSAAEIVEQLGLRDTPSYALAASEDRLHPDQWLQDYLSSLGEIAVARYLDVPWGRHAFGGVDVGQDIEVRRIRQRYYRLPIYRKDYEDVRLSYAVAVFLEDDLGADLLGWVSISTAWAKGRECAHRTAGECCRDMTNVGKLLIHRRHLNPMKTLKEKQ